MSHQDNIDKIYYELLREREEKIKKAAKDLKLDHGFIFDNPEELAAWRSYAEAATCPHFNEITEDARTRYMVKAAAIYTIAELKRWK